MITEKHFLQNLQPVSWPKKLAWNCKIRHASWSLFDVSNDVLIKKIDLDWIDNNCWLCFQLISGYNSYTTATQGTDGSHFDHMAFLSERASSEESKFLSDFVQTQMFVSFLDHMRSQNRVSPLTSLK